MDRLVGQLVPAIDLDRIISSHYRILGMRLRVATQWWWYVATNGSPPAVGGHHVLPGREEEEEEDTRKNGE